VLAYSTHVRFNDCTHDVRTASLHGRARAPAHARFLLVAATCVGYVRSRFAATTEASVSDLREWTTKAEAKLLQRRKRAREDEEERVNKRFRALTRGLRTQLCLGGLH
jgi:hypothetical protein